MLYFEWRVILPYLFFYFTKIVELYTWESCVLIFPYLCDKFVWFILWKHVSQSSRDSSKPPSPHKANLMVELKETKRDLTQNEENMRQTMERLQWLEDSQNRKNHGRRWEPRGARYQMHYESREEEDEDWRMQHYGERCHHQDHKSLILNCLLLMEIMILMYTQDGKLK